MTARLMTTVGVDKGYKINCVRREKKMYKKLKHSPPPYYRDPFTEIKCVRFA